jgi:hypothetical protein
MSLSVEVDDSNCIVIVEDRIHRTEAGTGTTFVRVTVSNVAALIADLRAAKAEQARREGMLVVGVSDVPCGPIADPAAFLRERAASYSSDAGALAHDGDRAMAATYRSIAGELRKIADRIGAPV